MLFFKKESKFKASLIGAILGDCLGRPFEFKRKEDIVLVDLSNVDLWSDDTSMILCTISSLVNKNSFCKKDVADCFLKWLYCAWWTPEGIVFDCGDTTSNALREYRLNGTLNGSDEELDCGNGSLMRIMPIAFYINSNKDKYFDNRFEIVRELSSITHSHIRCIIGCSIYVELILNLLNGDNREKAYLKMKTTILNEYKDYPDTLKDYDRILRDDISKVKIETLSGSGYIVSSLETSIYSFLTAKNYKDSLYTAIHFGEDTDTIASLTGGLTGLYFGYKSIPKKWIKKIARKDDIEYLCKEFEDIYCI